VNTYRARTEYKGWIIEQNMLNSDNCSEPFALFICIFATPRLCVDIQLSCPDAYSQILLQKSSSELNLFHASLRISKTFSAIYFC